MFFMEIKIFVNIFLKNFENWYDVFVILYIFDIGIVW